MGAVGRAQRGAAAAVSGCRRCSPGPGWGSRRVCEDLIAAGRVTVNGEVAVLGRRVDVEHDVVEVDGVPIGVRPGLVHYLLNKPRGVVTTMADTARPPDGRRRWCRPSHACSPSVASTRTPRACC